MLDRIAKNEEKRNRLQEQRDRERREMNESNNDASREKLSKIKEVSDSVVNGKVGRTSSNFELFSIKTFFFFAVFHCV